VQLHQVPGCLQAQPDVRSRHDHRLAFEARLWERRPREVLDVEEIGEVAHEPHACELPDLGSLGAKSLNRFCVLIANGMNERFKFL